MQKKNDFKLFFVGCLTLFLIACNNSSTSSDGTSISTDGNKINIGISFGQNVHSFFKAMQKGAEDAASELGVNLVVQSADSTVEKQTTQIENLVQKGVKAILVNPFDFSAVAPAVNEALNAGVGVFSMDINIDGATPTSFIASDNKKIGEMLGKYIDEKLGGKGKIALINDPTVTSLKDRETGLVNYLKNTDIKIVATQAGDGDWTKALNAAATILQANPDIDAFVGINENSALGIVSALNSSGISDVIVTGVYSTEDIMNGIKNGTISIGVAQDPYQMGYQSVINAVEWLNDGKIETEIVLDCEYMTQDNIQDYIDREKQYEGGVR